MNYTVELAQATDTKLADLYGELRKVHDRMHNAIESIHHYVGDTREPARRWGSDRGAWKLDLYECLTMPAEHDYGYAADALKKAHEALLTARFAVVAIEAAIDEQEAVYVAHGRWPRFFLVVSSDGHIHSSRSCSTCNWKTQYAWLPTLSGLDEAAAVAAHGAKLCTHCYPTAPVEWTNFFDAKKAAKKADLCPGSGRGDRDYHCPECGKYGRPTRSGAVRAHKKESK